MKQIVQALRASFAMMLGAGAHAAVVKYAYEAKISLVSGFDGVTQTAMLPQLSDLAGGLVATGDVINGVFEYDTSARLSGYQPPKAPDFTYVVYESKSGRISYVDQATGLTFDSSSIKGSGSIFFQDSLPRGEGYASDFFSMFQTAWVGDVMIENRIWLHDLYGNAFNNSEIPAQLDLSAFQFATVETTYADTSNGNRIFFSADLTSLQRVDVPEPASAFLFAIAGTALIGAKRRRR